MKKFSNILWGLLLIAIGTILTLNVFGVTDINIFFDGWWTLFIIVPCTISLFREKDKTWSIICILIGIALLLICQGILTIKLLIKLIIPIVFVIIGLSLIFKTAIERKIEKEIKNLSSNISNNNEYYAIFSNQKANYANEEFNNASFIALFGGAKCDLRQSTINDGAIIQCTSIFGGIDIMVPDYVCVKVKSTSFFGGVSTRQIENSVNDPTLYINATCIFGGVNIR